ncbi:MAG: class I SAM-dependent methyltransferase [Gemmatimonadaceae bacterium]|nr:class I SAM-dependent methyltransferase [Gemmatimonadaceae bacterium]
MIPPNHFDAEYYRRYYDDPRTAVVNRKIQKNEVAFVIAFCRHIGLDVRRFTDAGAGTGWWAKEFSRRYPACRHVETFDASEAACYLYGHRQVSLQNLPGPPSDLVVCRDVLRYVSDAQIGRVIRRLTRKCRGVLYLQVITRDDEIDKDASDMAGVFRTTAWYRRQMKAAGFRDCGMGLLVSGAYRKFSPFSLEVR